MPVGVGDPHATSSASVTFTPNTVVVSPSQVSSSLRSVSSDGSTYTFSNSSGKLGELAKGKVMLLEGFDAAVVTGVQHAGSSLVVSTAPAELSDIVQSGSIHVDAPPDYSDAFGTATNDDSAGTSDSTAAWSPSVGGGPVEIARAVPDAPRLVLLALALQGASKWCPTASRSRLAVHRPRPDRQVHVLDLPRRFGRRAPGIRWFLLFERRIRERLGDLRRAAVSQWTDQRYGQLVERGLGCRRDQGPAPQGELLPVRADLQAARHVHRAAHDRYPDRRQTAAVQLAFLLRDAGLPAAGLLWGRAALHQERAEPAAHAWDLLEGRCYTGRFHDARLAGRAPSWTSPGSRCSPALLPRST